MAAMSWRLIIWLVALVAVGCVGRPADEAPGEEIYLQVCARCHGADLEGGLGSALGPGSPSVDRSDQFLVEAVAQGRGRMPSFAQTLTGEQIERVVDYLRVVQGQE